MLLLLLRTDNRHHWAGTQIGVQEALGRLAVDCSYCHAATVAAAAAGDVAAADAEDVAAADAGDMEAIHK